MHILVKYLYQNMRLLTASKIFLQLLPDICFLPQKLSPFLTFSWYVLMISESKLPIKIHSYGIIVDMAGSKSKNIYKKRLIIYNTPINYLQGKGCVK